MTITSMNIESSKIGIISDLHLGVHCNSSQWHKISIEWAKWQKSEFLKHGIKDVVFCGDWHHNRSEISVSTLQISADILDTFSEFNLFIILGNHDIFYKHRIDVNSLSVFRGRKNIHIIDSLKTINYLSKNIALCPWNTPVSQIPKSDVIFGHFEIETFKMNTFRVCDEGMKIKDLLEKSSLIISGHFHNRHEKTFGAGSILYVGNPFQMDFSDVNNIKGYHILDLDTLEYIFYENRISPQYKKISLSELIEYGQINETVRHIFNNNIVKLKINKNISQEDTDILMVILNDLKPENLTLDYEILNNDIISDKSEKDLSGINIPEAITEFINLLDVEEKDDILKYTIELYNKCMA